MGATLRDEIQRRQGMWDRLCESGGPFGVLPGRLRTLRIYRGRAGIWRDTDRTAGLLERGGQVTVSVLLTPGQYPDEISDNELVYKYPNTSRPGSADIAEVAATQNAGRHDVPIFVVRRNVDDASLRDVYWGRVAGWSPRLQAFLIRFHDDLDVLTKRVEAPVPTAFARGAS